MPINVFGNNSNNFEKEIDTSQFVWKQYLGTKLIESKIEADIDMKNQFKTENLPCPQKNQILFVKLR